ncbi:uncharacterized protein LOC129592547 isoform X2 [Paramacrobiotus metropolitanus]|uniref:uncharacterized protein LOC129592547 isoform X2 n=1 Tax=Paramacrobiotus metropolitanus TaxID=2943436 RepID=UPI0024462683|nr:uncharacterized protein LOC129592547 isoform X2 [Paramacrobiotus metropolitanus]
MQPEYLILSVIIISISAVMQANSPNGDSLTGPFVIHDVVVVAAETRRQTKRVLNDSVAPLWKEAVGGSIKDLKLEVTKDEKYPDLPASSSDLSVRLIHYDISGTAALKFNQAEVRGKVHNRLGPYQPDKMVGIIPDESGHN